MDIFFELPYEKELARRLVREADQLFATTELTGISLFVDNRPPGRRAVLGLVFADDMPAKSRIDHFAGVVAGAGGKPLEAEYSELLRETTDGSWNAVIGCAHEGTVARLFVELPERN